MFKAKTTFVLGAGASSEIGFPLGDTFKKRLGEALDIRFQHFSTQITGDDIITQALRTYVARDGSTSRDINPFLHQAWHIRDALPQAESIDNFLEAHNHNDKIILCGKLAIARVILKAERKSPLYLDMNERGPDFSAFEKCWYGKLFKILVENVPLAQVDSIFKNVSFVSFNYDRSLEVFLLYALENYYRIERSRAYSLLRSARIIHPYGTCGDLPWKAAGDSGHAEFGGIDYGPDLLAVAAKIQTFSEQVSDKNLVAELQEELSQSRKVVFLGFGFHTMNMNLLSLDGAGAIGEVYATRFEMSDSNALVVRKQIKNIFGDRNICIHLGGMNMRCGEMLDHYRKSMPDDLIHSE